MKTKSLTGNWLIGLLAFDSVGLLQLRGDSRCPGTGTIERKTIERNMRWSVRVMICQRRSSRKSVNGILLAGAGGLNGQTIGRKKLLLISPAPRRLNYRQITLW